MAAVRSLFTALAGSVVVIQRHVEKTVGVKAGVIIACLDLSGRDEPI